MQMRHVVVELLALLLASTGTAVWAAEARAKSQQERLAEARRAKAERLEPYKVSSWEARAHRWERARFPMRIFTRGFSGIRPLLGGMPSGSGQVFGVGYIRGLESDITPGASHGNPNGCVRQCRRVVDAIPHHPYLTILPDELVYSIQFIPGHQLGAVFVDPHLTGDKRGGALVVTG